jgi:PAS domain S-box-containing protein
MEQTYDMIRSILEIAPIGIYIVNSKGKIEYLNAAMVTTSEDTYEQMNSLNVFEHPSYKKIGLDYKIRSVLDGDSFSIESAEFVSPFSQKTIIANFIGIPFGEGQEKKALIFVEDITQIKKATEELNKALGIKSQFISMVSHELRTPLAIIKEYIAIVQDGTAGELNNKQKGFLDIAKENVDRLAKLINNVLDYQKLDAGRMEFKFEMEDINKLVEETVKEFSPLINKKGLGITLSLARELPKIRFDRNKIMQVLTNLIQNALKFTDKGSIEISSAQIDNAVRISIKDTGIGIRKEDTNKLFQDFSQVGTGRERTSGGTGLGLAISKKIIQEHYGKIDIESEYGRGSTFSFFLPVKERRG